MSGSKIGRFAKYIVLIPIIGLILSLWSYVSAEILTSTTSELTSADICSNRDTLKYIKILSYDRIVGKSEILCIQNDLSLSTYHRLNLVKTDYNRKESWQIVFTQKIYQDGGLFWPIYI